MEASNVEASDIYVTAVTVITENRYKKNCTYSNSYCTELLPCVSSLVKLSTIIIDCQIFKYNSNPNPNPWID